MTFGSLFTGIGGMDLGLERAGMTVRWQVEIDSFCNRVLAKHWPDVVRHRDVREVGWCPNVGTEAVADSTRERDRGNSRAVGCEVGADGSEGTGSSTVIGGGGCAACGRFHLEPVDLICGGFPCQDISVAGGGAGLRGARSALWFEYLRILQELRPVWVLIENVPALRTRGIDTVLDGLGEAGYAAWPLVVGARHVGAPHRRDRVWIVAHRCGAGLEGRRGCSVSAGEELSVSASGGRDGGLDDADARRRGRQDDAVRAGRNEPVGADRWPSRPGEPQHEWEEPRTVESPLGGATDGLSQRLAGRHRRNALKALGNSVVPQVVEAIGRAILEAA